jgi:hypothetical protein
MDITAPQNNVELSEIGTGSRYGTESDINIMGTDATYMQCKAARTSGLKHESVIFGTGPDMGDITNIQLERVGSLAVMGDELLKKTFRGSRISSGERIVNQNMSLSFDPLTLICTCCNSPHSIIPSNGAGLVIIVSDQNFLSCVTGSNNNCVPTIRVEDSTLLELYDITQEILGRTPVPPGTLFLLGSLSHLVNVGTTIYAMDWLKAIQRFGDRWPSARVGPLTPVLREDSTGNTARHLVEIHFWFSQIYIGSNSILFIKPAWDSLIRTLGMSNYPRIDLDHCEIFTIALPRSLTDRTLITQKMVKSSSTAITVAMDTAATNELVLALLHTLSSLFGCGANPEDYLVRAPAECEGVKDSTNTTIVIIGASHLKRITDKLAREGITVVDLSHPGWTLTDRNIAQVLEDLSKVANLKHAVVVLDLISNTAFRYENREDGSLSLPYKHDDTYHLDGRVTTCTLETLHSLLGKATAIMDAIPGLKICLPPLPRYLDRPCCGAEGHCEGVTDPDHSTELMSKCLALRRQMRDYVTCKGLDKVWVPDTVRQLVPNATTTQELATGYCTILGIDGVHLTDEGYTKLSDVIIETVHERNVVNSVLSGPSGSSKTYYWRGFTSPVGSTRPKASLGNYKDSHPGAGKWKDPTNRFTAPYPRGRGFLHGPSGRKRN